MGFSVLFTETKPMPGSGGGGLLGLIYAGYVRWPLRIPTPLQSFLWPYYRHHLGHLITVV